ncbi:MAG: RNA 2',3'-cyclic phosphodiesterase [Halobacteriovoraceae bacterium]|nr:RNA 2',3'-cyclic phosphodiesterase [Halobacteriovoraceae bacterium]MBC99160.1 RNA 2',3'-cyclic phosphodiesterase [Halobacteriovoraceae bacterium]|tara:strand:- start:209196 stop:209747 length:552 start_codon:yes stop_codon:yes gene_type:complete
MGRYFIGIPLPKETRKKLKIQSWPGLSRYKDEKLVPQNNWHITLAFIGHLEDDQRDALIELLKVYQWGDAFKASARHFGAFPTFEQTKVLWMGISKGRDKIEKMALELRQRLDEMGITYDNKPFIPHITIARLRSPKNCSRLADNGKMKQEVSFPVNEIILYNSEKEKHPYGIEAQIPLTSNH